jgi:hypothetical protein
MATARAAETESVAAIKKALIETFQQPAIRRARSKFSSS